MVILSCEQLPETAQQFLVRLEKKIILKLLYILLLIPFIVYPAFAAEYDQIVSTSDGTLDVGIYTIPAIPNTEEPTKLKIDFLKSGTERIQQHIDYRVSVKRVIDENTANYVFGPMTRLLHTSPGSVTIPVEFSENGLHKVHIEITVHTTFDSIHDLPCFCS